MKTLTKAVIGLSARALLARPTSGFKRQRASDEPERIVEIHGFVSSDYEAVREAGSTGAI